jgi:hypothetical protein
MKGKALIRIGRRQVDEGDGWFDGRMDKRRKKWENVK